MAASNDQQLAKARRGMPGEFAATSQQYSPQTAQQTAPARSRGANAIRGIAFGGAGRRLFRSFTHDDADEERVAAMSRDGVLEFTIPISDRERGKRVPVQSQ